MSKLHVGQGATVVVVGEIPGGPHVTRLRVHNPTAEPVLVLDGQRFEGGWQHRMATRSRLVPATAELDVEVACVDEQARWHGSTTQTTRGRRVSAYVRAGYDAGAQSEVWSRVERYVERFAVDSATRSYLEGADASGVDRLVERVLRRVRPLDGQVGVLVGIGGQPLALEVFDHPDTLREQFAEIVRAAGLDALGAPDLPQIATPSRRARRLVERLERAEWTARTSPPDEAGCALMRGRSSAVELTALRRRGHDLHPRATYRRHPLLIGA